jgi:hypothetical protein
MYVLRQVFDNNVSAGEGPFEGRAWWRGICGSEEENDGPGGAEDCGEVEDKGSKIADFALSTFEEDSNVLSL